MLFLVFEFPLDVFCSDTIRFPDFFFQLLAFLEPVGQEPAIAVMVAEQPVGRPFEFIHVTTKTTELRLVGNHSLGDEPLEQHAKTCPDFVRLYVEPLFCFERFVLTDGIFDRAEWPGSQRSFFTIRDWHLSLSLTKLGVKQRLHNCANPEHPTELLQSRENCALVSRLLHQRTPRVCHGLMSWRPRISLTILRTKTVLRNKLGIDRERQVRKQDTANF